MSELIGEKKKRKVVLVIEDDGDVSFKFYMSGDVERIAQGNLPTNQYTAAEFWGVQFFGLCQDFLKQSQEVKRVPQILKGVE